MPVYMPRKTEPELMDDPNEANAYAQADFSQENEAFVERLLELVCTDESIAVLDLGTGPGHIPLELLRLRPRWRITAVEMSEPMLDLAREAEKQQGLEGCIGWAEVDATETPFKPRFFHVIFSNSLLHHIHAPDALWTEVKRLAGPGGHLFFRDLARPLNESAARQLVQQYAGDESELLKDAFYRSLLAGFNCDEVRAQLDQAGLSNLHVSMVTDRHLDVWGRMP